MRKNKLLKLWLIMVLCIPFTLLSACSSKVDVDGVKLMKEVVKEMKDVKSMNMQMEFIMKMNVAVEESKINMNMDANMDMDVTNEPMAIHGKTKMKVESLGQKQSTETEMYMNSDETQMYQYQNDGTGWIGSTSEISMQNLSALYSMSDELIEKMDIEVENGDKVDGKETYKVDVTLDGEIIKDILKNFAKENSTDTNLADVDLKDFSIVYSLYVDKDKKQMVKMTIDLKDTWAKLMKTALKASIPENNKMSFDELGLEINFADFNKIDEIVIPEEVINEANAPI